MSWFNEYQNAFNEAKQANESRYNQILQGYGAREGGALQVFVDYRDRQKRIMNSIHGVGQSQRTNLEDTYNRQRANAYQSMANRGLTNSTLLDSAERGSDLDREKAKMQLEDTLSRERSDYDARLSGDTAQARSQYVGQLKDKLDFMERRTDAYPDAGMYAAMGRGTGGMTGIGGGGWDGSGARPAYGPAGIPQTPNPYMPAYQPQKSLGASDWRTPQVLDNMNAMGANQFNAGLLGALGGGGGLGGAMGAVGGMLGGQSALNQQGYGNGFNIQSSPQVDYYGQGGGFWSGIGDSFGGGEGGGGGGGWSSSGLGPLANHDAYGAYNGNGYSMGYDFGAGQGGLSLGSYGGE